jgi:hypothetical protein
VACHADPPESASEPRSRSSGHVGLRRRSQKFLLGESDLKKRLTNIIHMLTGSGASAVFALISLSMAMRAPGPAAYGILALVDQLHAVDGSGNLLRIVLAFYGLANELSLSDLSAHLRRLWGTTSGISRKRGILSNPAEDC